jgi:hypothetical protein
MAPPAPPDGRPELAAATLVDAPAPSVAAITAAVRARHTAAVYGLRDVAIECAGIGEVHHTPDVELRLALGRPMREIVLYREGERIRSWRDASAVDFSETLSAPAAYVFTARDGFARLTTSAIWYEPPGR